MTIVLNVSDETSLYNMAGCKIATVDGYEVMVEREDFAAAINSPLTKSLRAESLDPSEHR
jgi:hypothetical protein